MVSAQEIKDILINKRGSGGTSLSQIIQALLVNPSIKKEHLILITDGRVKSSLISKSDKLIQQSNIQFKYVTTYIIGSRGDLSVCAPFARWCGSKTIEIKSETQRREIYGANEKDFNSLNDIDSINNADQFTKRFDELFNATKQKMIGTDGDPQLKAKYERMNERICRSGPVDSGISRKITALIRMASGAIMNVFDSDQITAMNF